MIADAIKDCTRRGDIVLDSFVGSGTTIMAAEKVGRRAYAIEIEPKFVDLSIRRWQDHTAKMRSTPKVAARSISAPRTCAPRSKPRLNPLPRAREVAMSRYKKGQSGNLKGRPKKPKSDQIDVKALYLKRC